MAEQATARQLSIDPGSFAQRADLALLDDAPDHCRIAGDERHRRALERSAHEGRRGYQ